MTDNDPFAEGREAHDAGVEETKNPYDLDFEEDDHMSWNDGWIAADDEQ